MSVLSADQAAQLLTRLVVPIAVRDILSENIAITPDIQYGMHEALSDMAPDTALLAIAFSAWHVAVRFMPDVSVACVLYFEADKIAAEYGQEWLARYDAGLPEGDMPYETLYHIPEDLEALADLMDTLCSGITEQEPEVAALCEILSIQARAHMEIAAYALGETDSAVVDSLAVPVENNDNIILFPLHLRS